jgi:hypothetical protein
MIIREEVAVVYSEILFELLFGWIEKNYEESKIIFEHPCQDSKRVPPI